MSDLIDREALRNALYEADAVTMEGVKIINTFPSVVPKKGEWIILPHIQTVKCSRCGFGMGVWFKSWGIDINDVHYGGENVDNLSFCPQCGADMRGEADGR